MPESKAFLKSPFTYLGKSASLVSVKGMISRHCLHRNSGFASVFLLGVLPFFVSLGFLVTVTTQVLNTDQTLKQICRSQLIIAQTHSGQSLTKLLNLNPLALDLRLQKKYNEMKLAMAIASTNSKAATEALYQLRRIKKEREYLDFHQKMIFRTQETENYYLLTQAQRTMNQKMTSIAKSRLFQHRFTFLERQLVALAVRPDNQDIAPIYELKDDFENAQALSISWNWKLSPGAMVAKYLDFQIQVPRLCSVSLMKKEKQWMPKLKTDKYLLKSPSPLSSFY